MNSVYDKVVTNQPICNILQKNNFNRLLFTIIFLFE